jgi:hypothetical protein
LAASIRPTPTVGRYYLEGRDIRLGLADGTVTEVLEGALSDQQDLIVGVSSATKQPAGPSGGARLGF